jgi:hypothetical protein
MSTVEVFSGHQFFTPRSRARLGRVLDKAMRLCARWWRKFSTSVIYPVAPNPCD